MKDQFGIPDESRHALKKIGDLLRDMGAQQALHDKRIYFQGLFREFRVAEKVINTMATEGYINPETFDWLKGRPAGIIATVLLECCKKDVFTNSDLRIDQLIETAWKAFGKKVSQETFVKMKRNPVFIPLDLS